MHVGVGKLTQEWPMCGRWVVYVSVIIINCNAGQTLVYRVAGGSITSYRGQLIHQAIIENVF